MRAAGQRRKHERPDSSRTRCCSISRRLGTAKDSIQNTGVRGRHCKDDGTQLQIEKLQATLWTPRQEEAAVDGEVGQRVGGAAAVLAEADARGGVTPRLWLGMGVVCAKG